MYKLYDLPAFVQDCVMSLTGFIRKGYDTLPYDELKTKFSDENNVTDEGYTFGINDDKGEEFFTFDYGCVGGKFINDAGVARLDWFKCYIWDENTDTTAIYDLTGNKI